MRAAAELGGAKVAGGKVAWWAAAQAAERAEAASADRQGAFWGLGAAASARAVGQGREHAEVSKEVAVEAEDWSLRVLLESLAARLGLGVEMRRGLGRLYLTGVLLLLPGLLSALISLMSVETDESWFE